MRARPRVSALASPSNGTCETSERCKLSHSVDFKSIFHRPLRWNPAEYITSMTLSEGATHPTHLCYSKVLPFSEAAFIAGRYQTWCAAADGIGLLSGAAWSAINRTTGTKSRWHHFSPEGIQRQRRNAVGNSPNRKARAPIKTGGPAGSALKWRGGGAAGAEATGS